MTSLSQQFRGSRAAVVLMVTLFSATISGAELPDHLHAALPVDDSLTMAETVDAALANYPQTVELAARSAQADAWQDRGQSWLADRPSLLLRYQTDRWGTDHGLQEYEAGIQLPLWNWGGRSATQAFGEAMSAESGAAGRALRWLVAGLVRTTVWNVALAQSDRHLAEQALDTAARLTKSVERRHELGDVALSDVLLAQSSHLAAQTTLIEAGAILLDAERAYRSATGLESRPAFHGEALSQRHELEPDHPALALANAEASRAEAAVAFAEKTAKTGTRLLIGPRSERVAFGFESAESMGITVNIPFGGSAHRRTEISAAVREAASARAARDQQFRELTRAMHESAHSLNVVHQNLEAATERMQLAARHQAMGESAYEKGELELIDLLIVQGTAIAAQRQVTRLVIDKKLQTALYNQAVGVLP